MDLKLNGTVALITGASRGIGQAIALELAREGMSLLLLGRDAEALAETTHETARLGAAQTEIHLADLRLPEAAIASVAAAVAHFGGLDLLVNCAGATKRGDFFSLTDADWEDGFALKFHGAVRLCRAAWPHLAARRGSVINVVGVGANTPRADFTIGGSVNSAFLNFTKALADIGGKDGIRVNAINPGFIHTTRLDRTIEAQMKQTGAAREAAEADIMDALKVQRFGRPEEIGYLAAFLASPQASYIHSTIINIDGGATRGL
ncbi:MAG: SDR family oxidoreductase [Dongiaceae bacterium]